MKYACKHDFIIPEHLSSFRDHILVVMVLRHMSFDVVYITILKTDVTMMKYIFFGLNPFDVIYTTILKLTS